MYYQLLVIFCKIGVMKTSTGNDSLNEKLSELVTTFNWDGYRYRSGVRLSFYSCAYLWKKSSTIVASVCATF